MLTKIIGKILPYIDLEMAILNITSFGSIAAWVSEHGMDFVAGFVLVTVGILNLAKAYSFIKKVKK